MTSRKQSISSASVIKVQRRFGVFMLIFFFIAICLMMMFDVVKLPYLKNKWQKRDDLKYILFWNKYYGYPYYGLAAHDGQDIFIDMNCSVNTCYVTETQTLMSEEEFDAVIFHVYHLKPPSTVWHWGKELLPAIRSEHQRYVFLVFESPIYSGSDLTAWGDIFNWTWTYRLDSDIPSPYGRVLPINSSNFYSTFSPQSWLTPDNQVDDYYDIVSKKSRLIAWLVSHCDTQSKREEYVKLLSADIAVDQFGDCDKKPWPKGDVIGFYKMLNESYKFYLSFENSLCKDYVTEKFFNILKYNVVPIVYGDAQYETVAPPMSYISALDFKSPKELANYLKYLDENPKAYAKYFWWKKHYKISKVKVPQPQSLCKLCELLHSNSSAKTYKDIHKWWTGDGDGSSICREPSFSPSQ